MVTDELLKFIRIQYDAGMKTDDISAVLLEHGGWERSDVEEGFTALKIPFVSKIIPKEVVPAPQSAPATVAAVSPVTEEKVLSPSVQEPAQKDITPSPVIEQADAPLASAPIETVTPATSSQVVTAPPSDILDVAEDEGRAFDAPGETDAIVPSPVGAVETKTEPTPTDDVVVEASTLPNNEGDWDKELLRGSETNNDTNGTTATQVEMNSVSTPDVPVEPSKAEPQDKQDILPSNNEKKGVIDDFLGLFGASPEPVTEDTAETSLQEEKQVEATPPVEFAPIKVAPALPGEAQPVVSSVVAPSFAPDASSEKEDVVETPSPVTASPGEIQKPAAEPVSPPAAPPIQISLETVIAASPAPAVPAPTPAQEPVKAPVTPSEPKSKIDKDEEIFGPISFSLSGALTGEQQAVGTTEQKVPATAVSAAPQEKPTAKSDWSLQKFLTERSNPTYVKEITPPVPPTAATPTPAAAIAAAPLTVTTQSVTQSISHNEAANPATTIDATNIDKEKEGNMPPISLRLDAIVDSQPAATAAKTNTLSPGSTDIGETLAATIAETPANKVPSTVDEKLAERGIKMFKRTMETDIQMQKERSEVSPSAATVTPTAPEQLAPKPETQHAETIITPQEIAVHHSEVAAPGPIASHGESMTMPTEPPMTVSMSSIVLKDKPEEEQKEQKQKTLRVPTFTLDEDRKQSVKRVMRIAILGLVVLVVIAIGFLSLRVFRTPEPGKLFTDAVSSFLASPAFSYNASISADITTTPVVPAPDVTDGVIRFDVTSAGGLANTPTGLGDGSHEFHLRGGIGMGEMATTSDITSEVRTVGNKVYFHITDVPVGASIPKELLSQYWVEVDLGEIAKELSLSGIATGNANEEILGGTGGQSIVELLKKYPPFTPGEALPLETLSGVPALHFALIPNEENFLQLTIQFYKKFTGRELLMNEDDRTRMKNAFQKFKGELWVDKKSHAPLKMSIIANLDDQILGIRAKGVFGMTTLLTLKSGQTEVKAPEVSITTADLGARLLDYRKTEELNRNDSARINRVLLVVDALSSYYEKYKRYPGQKNELYAAKLLASSTVPLEDMKEIQYSSYISPNATSSKDHCRDARVGVCAFYHIGIGLENPGYSRLSEDADVLTGIHGADTAGCQNEPGKACYDLVSPLPGKTPTSTTAPAATTTSSNPK